MPITWFWIIEVGLMAAIGKTFSRLSASRRPLADTEAIGHGFSALDAESGWLSSMEGNYFWCRHCHGLAYSSQRESRPDRLMRKARKIRERLKASDNLTMPIWRRPKGMHQKTFDRLRMEAEVANALAWDIIDRKFIGLWR